MTINKQEAIKSLLIKQENNTWNEYPLAADVKAKDVAVDNEPSGARNGLENVQDFYDYGLILESQTFDDLPQSDETTGAAKNLGAISNKFNKQIESFDTALSRFSSLIGNPADNTKEPRIEASGWYKIVDDFEQHVNETDTKIEQLDTRVATTDENITNLETDVSNLQTQTKDIQNTIGNPADNTKEPRIEASGFYLDLQELTSTIGDKRDTSTIGDDLYSRTRRLNENLTEYETTFDNKVSELDTDLAAAKAKIDEMTNENNYYTKSESYSQDEVDNLFTNVATPTTDTMAANKKYVDDTIAAKSNYISNTSTADQSVQGILRTTKAVTDGTTAMRNIVVLAKGSTVTDTSPNYAPAGAIIMVKK